MQIQFGQAPLGITVSGLAGFLENPEESTVVGKLGYAALPYADQTFGTLALWSWCIAADSTHPEEAFELAVWLTSEATERQQTEMNGQISAVSSLFNDEGLVSQMPWLPGVGAALENSNTQPLIENGPALAEKMQEMLSAVATGVEEPAAALQNAQNDLAETFGETAVTEAPAVSMEESEPVTLTISRWAGPHADDQIEVIKQFEEQTGHTVVVDAIDYGQLYQKQVLNMSGATGGYDLVWAQEIWVPDYVGNDFLLPMNDFIDAGVVDGFDTGIYNQSLLATNTFDENLYCLPTFVQTPILVYNTEMIEAAGLTVPDAWTWEATLEIASHFKGEGSGIALPAQQGQAAVDVWAAMMRSNGGDYFDADGALALTQDANVEATQFWADLIAVSMDGSPSWHFDDVNNAIQFGQAPLGITVSGLAGFLEDPAESIVVGKLGYAALPYADQSFGTLALWSWCIAADSNNPQAAFELAVWLTSEATERQQTEMNGQISAVRSLFNDEGLVSQMPWLPGVGAALENSNTQPLIENGPALAERMQEMLSAVATGVEGPAEALENAQNDLASMFE